MATAVTSLSVNSEHQSVALGWNPCLPRASFIPQISKETCQKSSSQRWPRTF